MSGLTSTGGAAALRRAGALERSITTLSKGAAVGVGTGEPGWQVLAWAPSSDALPPFEGAARELDGGTLLCGPTSHPNAALLRGLVPGLRPQVVGRMTSAGLGDRLGLATPGHVAALRTVPGSAPVLAQQSARELMRTGRSFTDVLDAATVGALAAGWEEGYGADGDHLKTIAELDAAIEAGCTMFTADPIDLVPDLPADAPAETIEVAFGRVPWGALEDDPRAFGARYPERMDLGDRWLSLGRDALRAAAARFGPAVVQVVAMYRHLVTAVPAREVEFEVAVDEIDFPTTPVDHVYLAVELRRLGVRWASLAPRFVGRFEKGIDYLGDPTDFAADVAVHAALARSLGPYKLSLHSGSDKFAVYDALVRETRGLVHVKTSGTSYLVALGTIARARPDLMRRVWRVALEAYSRDRLSYHVSAAPPDMPRPDALSDRQLGALLDEPASREILHVTYGAVLHGPELGDEVREAVWVERDAYWSALSSHIGRHLAALSPAVMPEIR